MIKIAKRLFIDFRQVLFVGQISKSFCNDFVIYPKHLYLSEI